ncbi:MAG: hypothetical protein HUJ93_02450 [Bacteroidales bacterium]|nr:hypothetical protein [Bacteroidales bacterium]
MGGEKGFFDGKWGGVGWFRGDIVLMLRGSGTIFCRAWRYWGDICLIWAKKDLAGQKKACIFATDFKTERDRGEKKERVSESNQHHEY